MGLISYFKKQYELVYERDPAIHSFWEMFLYPSVRAIIYHRVAHKLYTSGHFFLARWVSQKGRRRTGIEIHPGAQIGKRLYIDHGAGVVIGETTIIGDNVTLFQGVVLGGTGKEHGKRHPTLGNNVMVCAGAKVLGSFTVGDNSKIGAGSVVIDEVPPNSTVVGVPGRVVRLDNERVTWEDMDTIHLPDPIMHDIRSLQAEYERLYGKLRAIEKKSDQVFKEHEEKIRSDGDCENLKEHAGAMRELTGAASEVLDELREDTDKLSGEGEGFADL